MADLTAPSTQPRFSNWFSGVALIIAAPFLLFPSQFPLLTTITLILLATSWVVELFYIRPQPALAPVKLTLVLFGIMIAIAILISADPQWTLPKATGLILGIASLNYLVRIIQTPAQLHYFLALYICIALGMILLGILAVNWSSKIPFLARLLEILPQQLLTLPGSSDGSVHANQLAGTLLFLIPLTCALSFSKNLPFSRLVRPFMAGLTLLLTTLLIFSQSRAGWLGASAGLVALLWFYTWMTNGHWRIGRWLLPLTGLVTLIIVISTFGWERILNLWLDPPIETLIGTFSTLGFRQEVWYWSLIALQDFPFTGTGLGTFRSVVFRLYPIAIDPTFNLGHAHNIYLQVALDTGIPGVVFYVSLVLWSAYMAWQVAKHHAQWRPLMLGTLAILVALHTYGLLDALALGSKTGLLFWLLLAFPLILYRQTASNS